MSSSASDVLFTGPIPELYDRHLVPLIFDFYAKDLAARLAGRPLQRVLEVAAGTGVLTRALLASLPASVELVATDLNQPMLERAAAVGTARAVEWRQADALQLPFEDASFDAVVCQFGAMFFPDRAKAYAEAKRVLKPGGLFAFSVWDRIEDNELADETVRALATLFPADPPRFLARTPHGYFDPAAIAADLARAGFTRQVQLTTLAGRSIAETALSPAIAYCQGTLMRSEIEARGASRLAEATEVVAQAIARRFGPGPVDAKMQAHVVMVEKS